MFQKGVMKKTVLALTVAVSLGISTKAFAAFSGEYRQGEILSFGSSLTANEEAALREYFGVSKDMEAIYVDKETAIKQLGLADDALDDYTGGWYSSAYVHLTDQGGIKVSSNNISLVTNEMFANALMTSGILNCEVTVSAPFTVTGESALAGILAGAEQIMGESLSETNKIIAQEEIDTTLEIAEEILNNPDNEINSVSDSSTIASGIMNDIKEQIIKDSPNSTQIGQIIVNVSNQYGVELSEESKERVANLMEEVNELDIDYQEIKDTLKNISDSISENLKEAGIKLKESGLLTDIKNWFVDLFKGIGAWLKELFVVSNEVDTPVLDEEISVDVDSSNETANEVIDVNQEETEVIEGEENEVILENEQEEFSQETSVTDEEEIVQDETTPHDLEEESENIEENVR